MFLQNPVYPVSYDKSDKFNEYLRMQRLIGMDPQALASVVGFVPLGTVFQKSLMKSDAFEALYTAIPVVKSGWLNA